MHFLRGFLFDVVAGLFSQRLDLLTLSLCLKMPLARKIKREKLKVDVRKMLKFYFTLTCKLYTANGTNHYSSLVLLFHHGYSSKKTKADHLFLSFFIFCFIAIRPLYIVNYIF